MTKQNNTPEIKPPEWLINIEKKKKNGWLSQRGSKLLFWIEQKNFVTNTERILRAKYMGFILLVPKGSGKELSNS